MVFRIADNIISPLGETTAQNYEAVKQGRTLLRRYEHYQGIPEPFTASLLTDGQWQRLAVEGLSRFESLAYHSARQAISEAGIDATAKNVVFILSTTKANIELLGTTSTADTSPAAAACHVATALGMTAEPIAVSNACISGVSAIILALRLLEAHSYDYAIVCGADVLTPFIISGFQSLKALSADPCRPFDIERLGLNLGEAAATLVLGNQETGRWAIETGVIRNDAFHISSPSKNGEGARLALEAVLQQTQEPTDRLAMINAHGTATMFNDQMESVAIERAGLSSIPVNAVKGYFGHTLGAAGILETIITIAALDDHTILGTKGFEEHGVSGKILLTKDNKPTDKQRFIKMISGFGGCNAALMVTNEKAITHQQETPLPITPRHQVRITPTSAVVDGRPIACEGEGMTLLTNLYKRHIGDYPKYYKMDALSRLGFVATELLLQTMSDRTPQSEPRTDRAIILFNRTSSIQADLGYLASIQDPENYFPSPSAFVYTLPNIVTGEIAIRNHYLGETSFYILPEKDLHVMEQIVAASFADPATQSIVCGWLDYQDDNSFEAEISLVTNQEQ